jgi:hypothetical protein
MLLSRLMAKELMATRAAMPSIIEDINSNKRCRLLRLSRQAICQSHELKGDEEVDIFR